MANKGTFKIHCRQEREDLSHLRRDSLCKEMGMPCLSKKELTSLLLSGQGVLISRMGLDIVASPTCMPGLLLIGTSISS